MDEDDDFKPERIRHFIYAAEPPGKAAYAVLTSYWETDAIHAVGQVYRFTTDAAGAVQGATVLNTNDGLGVIWGSPEGNAWVGSAWGRAWTTANAPWDPAKFTEVTWDQTDPDFRWQGTDIPRDPNGGGRYNITAIGGSSDRDVHLGTFSGHIVHWDGVQWRISFAENERPIVRMHGTGASNLWAVGRDGLVLHFDGHHWRVVPLPGDADKGEVLTGVWALSPDEVYICSVSGAIFHGGPHGLERLGEYPHSFYGIVEFHEKMYLAAGDAGICTLEGNQIAVIKGNVATTGIYRLQTRLAFVEPTQKKARILIHDPNSARPWVAYG